jgi:hypothetical protein
LIINLVRLGLIASLIGWSIMSWGPRGAIAVTVLALGLGKAIGLLAMGHWWHVGIGRLLPWRALGAVSLSALGAGVPALVVAYSLPPLPFVRVVAAGIVYASAYIGLALSCGLLSARERTALVELVQQLGILLPLRHQHRAS